jgi:hypothetical protein
VNNTFAILLNGGIKAGKDEAVRYISMKYSNKVSVRECKDKLHILTMSMFNVQADRYWEIYNNRQLKEKPLIDFQITEDAYQQLSKVIDIPKRVCDTGFLVDISIRQAMIYVSEVVCKPSFGADYFGKVRAMDIEDDEIVLDGSCGFLEELPPLVNRVGMDNILLIRVYRDGCSNNGDSRAYIPDGVIKDTVDVYNNGTLEEYYKEIDKIVSSRLIK